MTKGCTKSATTSRTCILEAVRETLLSEQEAVTPEKRSTPRTNKPATKIGQYPKPYPDSKKKRLGWRACIRK
jgi:hypothetical protein